MTGAMYRMHSKVYGELFAVLVRGTSRKVDTRRGRGYAPRDAKRMPPPPPNSTLFT